MFKSILITIIIALSKNKRELIENKATNNKQIFCF